MHFIVKFTNLLRLHSILFLTLITSSSFVYINFIKLHKYELKMGYEVINHSDPTKVKIIIKSTQNILMSNNSLSKHNSIQSKETLGDKINNKNKDINDNKVTKKACDKTPTHQTSIKSFTKPNIPPYTSPPLTFSNHTKKDKNYQKQLVTDYFTVVKRSSLRKCKTDIENEKNNQLEEQIISQFEEGLKIVELPGKGRGVLAEKKFYRGDFIVEYAGDLIDLKEAKLRDTRYKLDRNIGCYMYYFEVAGKHYCVDATPETDRKGRLLNHSCKTFNCKTKAVWVRKLKLPKLILMATRDIEIGEELLYDYGERDKEAIKAHPWLKE